MIEKNKSGRSATGHDPICGFRLSVERQAEMLTWTKRNNVESFSKRDLHAEAPGEPLKMRDEPGLRPCPSGFFKFLSTGLDGLARIALTRGPLM
jgi:hypothetical protein